MRIGAAAIIAVGVYMLFPPSGVICSITVGGQVFTLLTWPRSNMVSRLLCPRCHGDGRQLWYSPPLHPEVDGSLSLHPPQPHSSPGSPFSPGCDNSAVVEVINNHSAKDNLLCHLMRCLFFVCAYFEFTVVARHTAGILNGAADALSRNKVSNFFSQIPFHSTTPTPVPPELCWGLSVNRPDWTSPEWTSWFIAMLKTL